MNFILAWVIWVARKVDPPFALYAIHGLTSLHRKFKSRLSCPALPLISRTPFLITHATSCLLHPSCLSRSISHLSRPISCIVSRFGHISVGEHIEVKSTAGNTHLGGEDFNNGLISHFIQVCATRSEQCGFLPGMGAGMVSVHACPTSTGSCWVWTFFDTCSNHNVLQSRFANTKFYPCTSYLCHMNLRCAVLNIILFGIRIKTCWRCL